VNPDLPDATSVQFQTMSTNKMLSIAVISYQFDNLLTRTITSLGSVPDRVEIILQLAKGAPNDYHQFQLKYETMIEAGLMRILPFGDDGIFSAMNRVRLAATGEYLWFINSGDEFLSDLGLERVLSHLTEARSYGFRTAQVHGQDTFVRPSLRYKSPLPRQIGHVGAVFHRSAYSMIAFNERQSVSSDQDFTEQCFHQSGWQYVPEIIGVFQLDGVSSRYRFSDFKAFANESRSLRVKFLLKMLLRLLVGTTWLHRILLFRKCDHVESSSVI
jgi:hypothetical protein|tara:strand:+ start:183 stop:998 length:816 start_codon:yes stop_codon:yes gene_type:complete